MPTKTVIPELKYLLDLVEKHYGRKLSTTTDFESLSVIIEKETGELLSSSTLKRLYGYVSLNTVPRKSTLDILSRFVGKRNFDVFRNDLRQQSEFSSNFFSAKTIDSHDLKDGQKIRIGWAPDRVVTLLYLGNNQFEVESSINASLKEGDRFEQMMFMEGYSLYISHVLRDGENTPAYVAGINGGLNLLERLEV